MALTVRCGFDEGTVDRVTVMIEFRGGQAGGRGHLSARFAFGPDIEVPLEFDVEGAALRDFARDLLALHAGEARTAGVRDDDQQSFVELTAVPRETGESEEFLLHAACLLFPRPNAVSPAVTRRKRRDEGSVLDRVGNWAVVTAVQGVLVSRDALRRLAEEAQRGPGKA